MLKILVQAAIIGAFAFAVGVAGLSAWRSFHQNDNQPDLRTSEQQTANSGSNAALPTRTKEGPEEAIARYNLWLMIFTGALAFVALLQIGFLFNADSTATKAANAAWPDVFFVPAEVRLLHS